MKQALIQKNVNTNMIVNTPDVILKDITIEGNLYLTEGIGNGDVTLDNVTVKGHLMVKGGGANSVVIRNSSINQVIINKLEGLIRVVLENTTVEEVKTYNEVTLELKEGAEVKVVEGYGKAQVTVEEGASIVELQAVNNEVVIEAKGAIESIKTTADIIVNGVKVEANSEVKVSDGKAPKPVKSETKPIPTESSTTPEPISRVVNVSSVKLNKSHLILDVGESINLTASIEPSNATNKSVTWISSNPNVAAVDSNGKVTALSSGFVTITVTTVDGNKTDTCIIAVGSVGPERPVIIPLEQQTDEIWRDGILTTEELEFADDPLRLDIKLPEGIGTSVYENVNGYPIRKGYWMWLSFYDNKNNDVYNTIARIEDNDIKHGIKRMPIGIPELKERLQYGETYTIRASIGFAGEKTDGRIVWKLSGNPSKVKILYDVTPITISTHDVYYTTSEQFSMYITVEGIVEKAYKDDFVRLYAVINDLSESDIEFEPIKGEIQEIVTDDVERAYVGADEGDLVLAWGPKNGFPFSIYDYEKGVTTEFKVKINKSGTYTVRFVFYDITAEKQLNPGNNLATITITDEELPSIDIKFTNSFVRVGYNTTRYSNPAIRELNPKDSTLMFISNYTDILRIVEEDIGEGLKHYLIGVNPGNTTYTAVANCKGYKTTYAVVNVMVRHEVIKIAEGINLTEDGYIEIDSDNLYPQPVNEFSKIAVIGSDEVPTYILYYEVLPSDYDSLIDRETKNYIDIRDINNDYVWVVLYEENNNKYNFEEEYIPIAYYIIQLSSDEEVEIENSFLDEVE